MMDYLPSVAITVLFCALMPWGVNSWILADTVITAVFGLAITFFPHHFLKRQVKGDLDDVHLHLYRMCGLMLLSSTLFAMLARKSRDPAVTTAILWARVVGISVYVMARLHGYMQKSSKKSPRWNEHALVFGIYGDCLWLLGNLIYALKMTDWGGKPSSKADFYLMSDFVQCILFAVSFFVMPRTMIGFQTTKTLGQLHTTLIRMMAAFVFNTGIIAWRSFNFTYSMDKLWHLVSRILTIGGLLTAQIYAQYTTSSWTFWHMYFGMVGMSIWSFNSSLGYFQLKDAIEKIQKSSNSSKTKDIKIH